MRQECIQAVQQAAQRTLTAREIQNIEDRIYRNMRSIARDDPMSWRQLPNQSGYIEQHNWHLKNYSEKRH